VGDAVYLLGSGSLVFSHISKRSLLKGLDPQTIFAKMTKTILRPEGTPQTIFPNMHGPPNDLFTNAKNNLFPHHAKNYLFTGLPGVYLYNPWAPLY